MKVKVIQSYITADGAVNVGTLLEVADNLATDLLNARLAEPVKPAKETATAKPVQETATK